MKRLRTVLLCASMMGMGFAGVPDADAARGSGARAAAPRTARPARAKAPRPAAASPKLTAPKNAAKDPSHLSRVNARVKLLSKYAKEGRPARGGMVEFDAAFAELHPAGKIRHKETRELRYGVSGQSDQSQRLSVSGASDGIWRGHLIGTVSTHDLASLDGAAYTKAVNQRISSDRVQVSYDYGPGTPRTILAKGVKSGGATAVEIAVPLNKNGVTRIIYDRTDARSGYVVGSSGAYVGRVVELNWSGN